jgi:hypothetical protein
MCRTGNPKKRVKSFLHIHTPDDEEGFKKKIKTYKYRCGNVQKRFGLKKPKPRTFVKP